MTDIFTQGFHLRTICGVQMLKEGQKRKNRESILADGCSVEKQLRGWSHCSEQNSIRTRTWPPSLLLSDPTRRRAGFVVIGGGDRSVTIEKLKACIFENSMYLVHAGSHTENQMILACTLKKIRINFTSNFRYSILKDRFGQLVKFPHNSF